MTITTETPIPARLQARARASTIEAGSTEDLRSARRSVSAFFLLLGVSVSTWAALVPFAKSGLRLDEATLGAILLAFGGGTIVATLGATTLVRQVGSRATLAAVSAGLGLFLPFLAIAPTSVALAVLLFGFGACAGLAGVTANAQAIAVETRSGRPIMSSFHALFSIGGLAGAGSSGLALRLDVPIERWTIVVSVALMLLAATNYRGLVSDREEGEAPTPRTGLPAAAVFFVGLMTLALYLAEGAILDWGAVFLHEYRGYGLSAAALGYAAFSIAMATGRLLGDRIVERLGPVAVVRFGSLLAAAGFLVLVLAPWRFGGLLGCALIGLGASNVVPTLISASARVSDTPAAVAVSTVAAMGTFGLIAGPAAIGFVAQATSLPIALSGMTALLLVVGLKANAVRAQQLG